MSPVRLADLDSDHDGPRNPACSQDDQDRVLLDRTCKPTHPGVGRQWAIGDKVNEPVAIVGIGKSMSQSLFS